MAIFFSNLARNKSPKTLTLASNLLSSSRSYISEMRRSTLNENILRVLRTEFTFSSSRAPPTPSPPSSFSIDERPGENWVRLTRTLPGESVRIDATMIDGAVSRDDRSSEPHDNFEPYWIPFVRFHISLVVEISKGAGTSGPVLHAVCSAWPEALDVHKVYTLPPDDASRPARPFLGPDFGAAAASPQRQQKWEQKHGSGSGMVPVPQIRKKYHRDLDAEMQRKVRKYLEEKGVNDELAKFLHRYIKSKACREFLKWLKDVQAYVKK